MSRTTELPDQIVELLERSSNSLTSSEVATQLKASERTVRTHLFALTEKKRITRSYAYNDQNVGAYRYSARVIARKK